MIHNQQNWKLTSILVVVLTVFILTIVPEETEGKICYTKPLQTRSRNSLSKRLFGRLTTTSTTTTTTRAPYFSSFDDDDDHEDDDNSYEESLQLPSELEERFMEQNNYLDRISEIAEEESQIFEKIFQNSDDLSENSLRSHDPVGNANETPIQNQKQKSDINAQKNNDEINQNNNLNKENNNNEKEMKPNHNDDDNFAIMDIPLPSIGSTTPIQIVPASTTPVATGPAATIIQPHPIASSTMLPPFNFQPIPTFLQTEDVRFHIRRPSRSTSNKAYKRNAWKNKKSASSVFGDSTEEMEQTDDDVTVAKKVDNVPCTCGVFLSSQIPKGSSSTTEPEGEAIITNELDKIYKCNSVGQKQCQTKCLETLVQHLPNSANILCATVNRDIRKERAYLYIKNCQDKWITTNLTAGKEYCCKKGKPYSCPMV